MLFSIAPEKNREQWMQIKDTDFAHENDQARFRVNVFEDRKGIGSVMRQIPNTIRTAEEMGLPRRCWTSASSTRGWWWSPGRLARARAPPWPR